MARRNFSEKQKAGFLAKFERWEGSAAAFCRKQRLSCQTLRSWRLGAAKQVVAAKAPEFVEVELEVSRPRQTREGAEPVAELDLGAGVVLRVFAVREARS